ALLTLAAAALAAAAVHAAEITVPVGGDVAAALSGAADGDVLRLGAGTHSGPLVVDRSVAIVGEGGAVLEGPGSGSVITVTAPDVRIEGLEIRGSGRSLPDMDSAILVRSTGARARIVGNRLSGNAFGVY